MLKRGIGPLLPEPVKRPLRRLRTIGRAVAQANWLFRVHPSPVFVLGNYKAGTTAIGALLAKVAGVSFTYDVFYFVKKNPEIPLRDFVGHNRRWFSAQVNKAPEFTFMFDELRECFPSAKFIFIIRDPRDNVRSILNRLKIPGNLNALDRAMLDRVSGGGGGWVFEDHLTGDRCEGYVDVLSQLWRRAATVYAANIDRMVLIRYEDFIADKANQIEQLAEAVGLKPAKDISDALDVQYQPAGDHSVSWQDFFGTENLRRIDTRCAERMRLFGYE